MHHSAKGLQNSLGGFSQRNKIINNSDCETYYCAMSKKDYKKMTKTGRVQGTRETFISPTKGYSEKYDGVLTEIKVKKGTTERLAKIGYRDESNLVRAKYSSMPQMKNRPKEDSWILHNSYFKNEGGQINIGLGIGDALDIFNDSIIGFKRV